jgi:hypothetical protein
MSDSFHMESPAAKERMAEWEAGVEVSADVAEARRLLLPQILDVERRFIEVPRQWPTLFHRLLGGAEPVEVSIEIMGSGLAQHRPTGAPVSLDSKRGDTDFRYLNKKNDLGLSVRLESLEKFSDLAFGLTNSFHQTEESLHANVFNTGTVYNASIIGDGCPLFFDRHPIRDGAYSNVVHYELNETGIEAICRQIRLLPDAIGLRLFAKPVSLVVPIDLQHRAYRLMQEIKAMDDEKRHLYPRECVVLDYLHDPKTWYVTTTIPGLWNISWQPFRLDIAEDDKGLILVGTQSYGVGHYNPRACCASA